MRVFLKYKGDKALQQGYPWIFSNQVDHVSGNPESGDVVEITGADGRVYGLGLYHAESLIAVRFLTTDPKRTIDASFFRERLRRALAMRETLFPDDRHYRLVFSESDGIPGTIIDRYNDVLTWTTVSLGIDRRADMLLDALDDLLKPAAIVERNDSWLRTKDGLPERKSILRGSYEGPVEIIENGLRMAVDVLNGPKTGIFIDQRLHRSTIRRFARDRRVLDVFCSDGGFGLNTLAAGAQSVHAVDISEAALKRLQANAALNELDDRLTCEQGNALNRLAEMVQEKQLYDLVILDPPGFAKSRRNIDVATRAYQSININALQLIEPGGILATSSCSQAISERDFLKIIGYAAARTGSRLRLLYRGTQPPDHPVLQSMPETHYLKFFIFQKMGDELPGT